MRQSFQVSAATSCYFFPSFSCPFLAMMTEQSTSFNISEPETPEQHSSNERADAVINTDDWRRIQKHGHKGILTPDQDAQVETLPVTNAARVALKSCGVRLRGSRRELLEKEMYQRISEKVHAQRNPPAPKPDYSTTTQTDFSAQGFIPHRPQITQGRDYRNDVAITFWSANYHRVQGVTAVHNLKTSFKKSAKFSTPISERLDEEELPPDT